MRPGITAALWLGPAQEYTRYWIAGGDEQMPQEAVETFASAAWAALRANTIEEQRQ
jgi:DNA polymerase III psi subunit